jgi:hypothetical protein
VSTIPASGRIDVDPTVIGATIGGVATVIGALIGAWVVVHQRKPKLSSIKPPVGDHESPSSDAHDLTERRFISKRKVLLDALSFYICYNRKWQRNSRG